MKICVIYSQWFRMIGFDVNENQDIFIMSPISRLVYKAHSKQAKLLDLSSCICVKMLNWLKFGKVTAKAPPSILLPDPRESASNDEACSTSAANSAVIEVLEPSTPKRKRDDYGKYSPEQRAKMARYCIQNGPAKAARHFSSQLGRKVNESTLRSIKAAYLREKTPERTTLPTLPHSPRGRPLKIGQYDGLVQRYVRELRKKGTPVNSAVVIGATRGIITHYDKTLLAENGGHVELTKDWAKSLMGRMGLTKRHATKGVKSLPTDFESIKRSYIDRIDTIVKEDKIPDSLIINWDQTGVSFVPSGKWTMEEKGMFVV